MTDDALRRLTHDRRHALVSEAQRERLALQLRDPRYRRTGRGYDVAMLGHLLAARHHAAS
ncbi:MAG: hypothetical protein ACRDPV_11940 [Gaiellaceae bacterium]